jgi:signal peptidase I
METKKEKIIAVITDFIETTIVAVAISMVIYVFIAIPNKVGGQSMEPNFHDKELLMTNKTIQWIGDTRIGDKLGYDYTRGDVIIFNSNGTDLIKRVIAKSGDKIKIEDGKVFINDKKLDEKYIPLDRRTRIIYEDQALFLEGEEIIVPDQHYFVMGDNREYSKDSRYKEVGFINRDVVKGKVFLKYWPIKNFGLVKRGDLGIN